MKLSKHLGFKPKLWELVEKAATKRNMNPTEYLTHYTVMAVKGDLTKKELNGAIDIELY
jgi:hypothetical protein